MKHSFEQVVYYGDTDSYGVAWHGSYIKWMEIGRVEFCRSIGLDLVKLMNEDVTIPVTKLNVRYKASAKLDDNIVIETFVSKITPVTITFTQIIKDKLSEKVFTIGEVEVVAVNNSGRIYRKLPDVLKTACAKVLEV